MRNIASAYGVALGGSAGSLDAVHDILGAIDPTLHAVFLLVIHISPTVESLLPAVVGAYTSMRVIEAVDKLPLEPHTVVVAPPDYHMLVERDFTIALSRDRLEHFSRPAIDPTFESVGLAFRRRSFGALLSGSNADGATGLRSIQLAGGKTAAQDPSSATSPEMPRAAIDIMKPDLVSVPSGIGRWLNGQLGGAR